MDLTQTISIKLKPSNKKLYNMLDSYSFCAKNLRNYTNYIINQCSRISYKLKSGEILDSWEKALILDINKALYQYNLNKEKPLQYIDENNGFIANAYFLSYYLKNKQVYKEVPLATCSQIVIQNLCSDWKNFYKSIKEYSKNPSKFLGKPNQPKYYDKFLGRDWLTITYQNIKKLDNNILGLPKCFKGLNIKTDKENIKLVKVKTTPLSIEINIVYSVEDTTKQKDNGRYIGIDIGVNNLMAIASNTNMKPIIINGRPLKSINQYYNKEKARLQGIATSCNGTYMTTRILKLTKKRNNKVMDYLHKASKKVIDLAIAYDICKIVIGKNDGWKQEVKLGKRNTQNFVSIPFNILIQMLKYKADLVGIELVVVEEKYTSGTSYVDNELPTKENYNKTRRKYRGLFISNNGIRTNADINAAYQMMKRDNIVINYKGYEKIEKIRKVA